MENVATRKLLHRMNGSTWKETTQLTTTSKLIAGEILKYDLPVKTFTYHRNGPSSNSTTSPPFEKLCPIEIKQIN